MHDPNPRKTQALHQKVLRRVHVGGGTMGDAARLVAAQPLLWAGALALALSHLHMPLPATVRGVCLLQVPEPCCVPTSHVV